MMQTYQASVRVKVNGRSQVIKTEVRVVNVQDARWLLWAMYGFHSIQQGPIQIKEASDLKLSSTPVQKHLQPLQC